MSRPLRVAPAGIVQHVVNRTAGKRTIFRVAEEYEEFEIVLAEAISESSTRLLAYCVMPNHFHLLVLPTEDGSLSRLMQIITGRHARRWRFMNGTTGHGSVYQGRYGSFAVQADAYFLIAARYVERNPVTAGLVSSADDWRWGSPWRRARAVASTPWLTNHWPVPRPANWVARVNGVITPREHEAWMRSMQRGVPLADDEWVKLHAPDASQPARRRGRPRKMVSDTIFVGEASVPGLWLPRENGV